MASDNCTSRDKATAFRDYQKADEGFTLVELISVVAIIALLVAIAIPSYGAYMTKAQIARAIVEIRMLEQEINVYRTDESHLPGSLGDVGHGSLNDPWGNPYRYLKIEGGDIKGKGKLRRDGALNPLNSDYDLFSMGKDGASKTNLNAKESRDDIVRALGGGYVGLAGKF